MTADPSSSVTGPSQSSKVEEYLIPFAKQLPDGGFKRDWVDWEETPASCLVIPNTAKADQFAQIVSVEGFEFVDAKGNADADAAQVLNPPQNVQKGIYKVQFDVEAQHTETARQKAKEALKKGPAVFLLKVKLKAARVLESLAAGMGGLPGLGGLFGSQVAKPVPASGKIKLRLEPPLPVIWSDEQDAEDGEKRITVDTSKEDGTEFRLNLYQYNPATQEYEPTLEVLEVTKTCDFPVGFTVQAEGGKLRVKSDRLIIGDELIDGGSLKDTQIGEVVVTRKKESAGPRPINEPYNLPVYYKPIPNAKLQVRVLVKQCFFCDEKLPQKQEVCGTCGASAVRGQLDKEIFTGEKFELEFPDLPAGAAEYCYYMWKIVLPAGIRPCPEFVTEYQCGEFSTSQGSETGSSEQS